MFNRRESSNDRQVFGQKPHSNVPLAYIHEVQIPLAIEPANRRCDATLFPGSLSGMRDPGNEVGCNGNDVIVAINNGVFTILSVQVRQQ